jgi:hypothetical protein
MILPHFTDPHPRVRWAACNTFGQMFTDFGPTIQSKYHARVLPALMNVMEDRDNPRYHRLLSFFPFYSSPFVVFVCSHTALRAGLLRLALFAKR